MWLDGGKCRVAEVGVESLVIVRIVHRTAQFGSQLKVIEVIWLLGDDMNVWVAWENAEDRSVFIISVFPC